MDLERESGKGDLDGEERREKSRRQNFQDLIFVHEEDGFGVVFI